MDTASIVDAVYIYKRTDATRTRAGDDEEGYWKIDSKGNESKIVLYDKQGNPVDVQINNISKLYDDLLLFELNLKGKDENVLADKSTGKLYLAPQEIGGPMQKGAYGDLYYTYEGILYRFNRQNMTIEPYTAEGQYVIRFSFNEAGTCAYDDSGMTVKIRTKGKRLYDLGQDFPVLVDNCFYTVHYLMNAIKWSEDGDTDMSLTDIGFGFTPGRLDFFMMEEYPEYYQLTKKLLEVFEIPADNPESYCYFDLPKQKAIMSNISNGRAAIMAELHVNSQDLVADPIYNTQWIMAEFDGETITKVKWCNKPLDYDASEDDWMNRHITELAWENLDSYDFIDYTIGSGHVVFLDNLVLSINPETYAFEGQFFDLGGYQIYTKDTKTSPDKMLFTALRLQDSKVVMGEVDSNGQVTILKEKEEGTTIRNLIALN